MQTLNTTQNIKGVVHPEMKIQSLFTHLSADGGVGRKPQHSYSTRNKVINIVF